MTGTTRHQQRRRPRTFTDADRWEAALADCADSLGRAGLAVSTLARVGKHVRRFAAEAGAAPYDVTSDQVHGWLDALTCSPAAGYAYRTSLRTFYRWAFRAGRVLTDPTARPGPHPLARTVPDQWGQALAGWRRWLRAGGCTAATCATYLHHAEALGRQTGAPTPWDLTADDLTDWIARHRWSRETARSAGTALRSFYGWAYDLGHLDHNPAEQLPRVRLAPPNPRPATEDEYRAALDKADPDESLMLRLAAELGLRRAEVAGLHSRDLTTDAAGRTWLTVRGKGERTRRLPLGVGLASQLRQRPAGYTFPGQLNGHLSPHYVGNRVTALLPAGVTMHALRHRFATQAYGINRDVFTVQRLLGHASPATTQRYVQTHDDTLSALVDAVAKLDGVRPATVNPDTTREAHHAQA